MLLLLLARCHLFEGRARTEQIVSLLLLLMLLRWLLL